MFTPRHFLDLASRPAVTSALRRQTDAGTIRQLGRGLYDYNRTVCGLKPKGALQVVCSWNAVFMVVVLAVLHYVLRRVDGARSKEASMKQTLTQTLSSVGHSVWSMGTSAAAAALSA